MVKIYIDIEASVEATTRQNAEGMTKTREDIDRYRRVLTKTKPELIIECGSWQGGSALWFSRQGVEVVSIDLEAHVSAQNKTSAGSAVTWLVGSSTDQSIVDEVRGLIRGRRTMVVLDSDHRDFHVKEEIEAYGGMVSPGCYLVVEDGIVRWMPGEDYEGPLTAIEQVMPYNDLWKRDITIEQMHPVSMHPAGWWRRKG